MLATIVATKDLVARWRTPEGQHLSDMVITRLVTGESLGDLGLGEHEGRIDLRGILTPLPDEMRSGRFKDWEVREVGGLLKLERIWLAGIDFSGAHLESWRIFDSTIENCRFDGARCQDWRLYGVDVLDTSFVGADLRKAVLGAWHEGRGDVFRRVEFSDANLRSIICPAATFVDCDFGTARLAKVDFQSSSFTRCRFAGMLREVIFYDRGFKTGKPDANPMEDVDFSEAELRMVEFRRLNLDRVALPRGRDHLIVRHYRCVLERAARDLRAEGQWKGLQAVIQHRLKWAGQNQEVGVFNLRDIEESGGQAEAEFVARLLPRLEAECRTAG